MYIDRKLKLILLFFSFAGDQDAKVLMHCSYLVKPKLISGNLSKKWKPTREVIQEGFVLHIKVGLTLNP